MADISWNNSSKKSTQKSNRATLAIAWLLTAASHCSECFSVPRTAVDARAQISDARKLLHNKVSNSNCFNPLNFDA